MGSGGEGLRDEALGLRCFPYFLYTFLEFRSTQKPSKMIKESSSQLSSPSKDSPDSRVTLVSQQAAKDSSPAAEGSGNLIIW